MRSTAARLASRPRVCPSAFSTYQLLVISPGRGTYVGISKKLRLPLSQKGLGYRTCPLKVKRPRGRKKRSGILFSRQAGRRPGRERRLNAAAAATSFVYRLLTPLLFPAAVLYLKVKVWDCTPIWRPEPWLM